MEGKYSKKKNNLPIIRYLIYLMVVTMTVSGVSLSRYVSSSAVSDEARVAQFKVAVTQVDSANQPVTWSIDEFNDVSAHTIAAGSKQYIFNVKNNSEVKVEATFFLDSQTYAGATPPAAATVSHTSPFILQPGGSQNVTVTIYGGREGIGKIVKVHVEYKQVD